MMWLVGGWLSTGSLVQPHIDSTVRFSRDQEGDSANQPASVFQHDPKLDGRVLLGEKRSFFPGRNSWSNFKDLDFTNYFQSLTAQKKKSRPKYPLSCSERTQSQQASLFVSLFEDRLLFAVRGSSTSRSPPSFQGLEESTNEAGNIENQGN